MSRAASGGMYEAIPAIHGDGLARRPPGLDGHAGPYPHRTVGHPEPRRLGHRQLTKLQKLQKSLECAHQYHNDRTYTYTDGTVVQIKRCSKCKDSRHITILRPTRKMHFLLTHKDQLAWARWIKRHGPLLPSVIF